MGGNRRLKDLACLQMRQRGALPCILHPWRADDDRRRGVTCRRAPGLNEAHDGLFIHNLSD